MWDGKRLMLGTLLFADAWKPPAVPQPSIPRPAPAARPVSPAASADGNSGAASKEAQTETAPDQAEAPEEPAA